MKTQKITPPLSDQNVKDLKAGDQILISGKIYVARDAAHQRFSQEKPPFPLKGQILFYASPTPARPGKIIGSLGPTTASRMDAFTPPLLAQGLKATMGKGNRGPEVRAAMKKYKALYLLIPGGTAAVVSQYVKHTKVVAYPDLGPEAVLELEVANLPAIVAIDSQGRSLFEMGRKKYQTK